jgi:hypothetical protein
MTHLSGPGNRLKYRSSTFPPGEVKVGSLGQKVLGHNKGGVVEAIDKDLSTAGCATTSQTHTGYPPLPTAYCLLPTAYCLLPTQTLSHIYAKALRGGHAAHCTDTTCRTLDSKVTKMCGLLPTNTPKPIRTSPLMRITGRTTLTGNRNSATNDFYWRIAA